MIKNKVLISKETKWKKKNKIKINKIKLILVKCFNTENLSNYILNYKYKVWYLDWVGNEIFSIFIFFKKYIEIYSEYNDRKFRKKLNFINY